jgi:pyrroloquinoline-quinone synthase
LSIAAAFSIKPGIALNSAADLERRLREIGATRHHSRHRFQQAAARGKRNKGAGAGLGADLLLLSEHDPNQGCGGDFALRRAWYSPRMAPCLEDRDGDIGSAGSIERWLKLTRARTDSAYVESTRGILPATRFGGRCLGDLRLNNSGQSGRRALRE